MALKPLPDTPFLPVCLCPGDAEIAGELGIRMEPRSPCTRLAADLAGLVAHPAACLPHGCTVSSPEPPPCLRFRSLSPHHAGSEPGGSGSWSSWLHWPSKGPWGRAGWEEPQAFLCTQQHSQGSYAAALPNHGKAGKHCQHHAYAPRPHSSFSSEGHQEAAEL